MSAADIASEKNFQAFEKDLQALARRALALWDIPTGAVPRLINLAENSTFLVEAEGGYRSVLRVHRQDYHSRGAIESELAWLDALHNSGMVETPSYYIGRNGQAVQEIRIDDTSSARFLVLFQYVTGVAPDARSDMSIEFARLGLIAAHCHNHVESWERPSSFERFTWDAAAVFGDCPIWGDWRLAPGVTASVRHVLERVERAVCARLERYGKAADRFNLIHADMRLANLLVDDTRVRVIDFDDCGFGWFMYDFAAAISFIEDDPQVLMLKASWLRGYRSQRRLSVADEAEIDTFIMLRRMALLAWIGSRSDASEPRRLAANFASVTAQLASDYLNGLSQSKSL